MEERGFDVLLAQAQGKDRAAYEELLLPHLPMLLAYSRAICGDFHLAEDVVQETALIAFRNLEHLFPETDFASWLKAIARRQALAMRRKSRRLHPALEEALEEAFKDPSPDALQPQKEALGECLQALSDRSGKVMRSFYFDGSTVDELARAVNLNANTVKTLLHRGRLALEACMRRRLNREVSS